MSDGAYMAANVIAALGALGLSLYTNYTITAAEDLKAIEQTPEVIEAQHILFIVNLMSWGLVFFIAISLITTYYELTTWLFVGFFVYNILILIILAVMDGIAIQSLSNSSALPPHLQGIIDLIHIGLWVTLGVAVLTLWAGMAFFYWEP